MIAARHATRLAWGAFALGIAVVELGWRDPVASGVEFPQPRFTASVFDTLRSMPLRHIDDPAAAAVASGVIFGRPEHVAAADEAAFLDSGLWHLLAASGQNVAIVAGCCVLGARAVGRTRVAGAVAALAVIPAYVLVVGSGASIVRAGIMGEFAIAAWLTGRLPDVRHALGLAGAVICWVWPGAHRSLGMQLSFACVAALVFAAARLTYIVSQAGVPRFLAGGMAATVLCSLAAAPVLMLRTGAAPVSGIVANLAAVPLASCILVVGLAGSLVAAAGAPLGLESIGASVLGACGALAAALLRIARRAADLPAAQTTSWSIGLLVPLVACGLILAFRLGRPLHRRLVTTAVVLTISTCVVWEVAVVRSGWQPGSQTPLQRGDLRIAVLDVGQGDATLLATDETSVLIDTGPPAGDVVRRVRELGVREVDGIVLTHDSLDHRGGFEEALAALHPAWVGIPRLAPGPWQRIRSQAPRLVELCSGDRFGIGTAIVSVLHPTCDGRIVPRTGDIHNDGAMVLLVAHGHVRALLPADAEGPVLAGFGLPRLHLLRVSHHGSADPGLPGVLARTRPGLAAISVGQRNSYGHPARSALRALRAVGAETFRTDRDGTLAFDSDGRRLTLR